MKKMVSLSKLTCLFLVFFTITGCASVQGPAFVKIENIPEKKALIYIYKTYTKIGSAAKFRIKANDEIITTIPNRGYYPYMASPGKITFSSWLVPGPGTYIAALLEPWYEHMSINVEAGKTYYLKFEMRAYGKPTLTRVQEALGKKEIIETQLLPAYKE